jgi:hypothetical protein
MDTEPPTSQRQTVWQPVTLEAGLRLSAPPSHRQIDGPQRLPPELRRPFEAGRQRIVLLIATSQERLPARIAALGEATIVVDTETSTFGRKPGETVVVVFPTPGQSYLLQTVIETVAVQRLTLRYQDPRYDVRRRVSVTGPVTLSLIPAETVGAIERRQVRLMRAISQAPEGDPYGQIIADRVEDGAKAELSGALANIEAPTGLRGSLNDLSLGGASVTSAEPLSPESWAYRVISVRLTLPGLEAEPPDPEVPPMILDVLGVTRQVEATTSRCTLHLRFLARLPEACAAYFERLERRHPADAQPST